ncbi:endonuclease [Muriicola sp. Z0-33]|uniref:endonuclease/exonuclease/phosphatase family protein n=1 Tax=Muriicola sp. Z0-33 TaxID=2816957 RepID=UPI002238F10B|nr:endonuclease [Muriicola sp. Z0-33]MCW5516342.1 endonuclease [Muriicola sp. Z0-33]
MLFPFSRSNKAKNLHTIAFYNLENLFDSKDDRHTLDNDFTPNGFKKWTDKRYKKKLNKLSSTISKLGLKSTEHPPVLVGVAEIENGKVAQDLLSADALREFDYDYVHYESPDERGIDTALFFLKSHFEVLHSEPIALLVNNSDGIRDTTRDILYVKGKLNGEITHIFVNHWPSRRAGGQETEYKRVEAAQTLIAFMEQIEMEEAVPNYIIMGDFNDGPTAESIKTLVNSRALYNPMIKLLSPDRGSANYRRTWALFDQIIVSHSFLNYEKNTHSFAHANIFDERFLTEFKGRYAGNPFRTFVGKKYLGGYSDHFPVYIQLKYNV